ncbi:hypothetical protein ABIB40_002711 [Pedobacter sp. UYP30]|uniref:VCBS repeat-containing protein n=1 Tax=Pedobacter sp. UYP30 TaxID=1756400 RepID=UPI0033925017
MKYKSPSILSLVQRIAFFVLIVVGWFGCKQSKTKTSEDKVLFKPLSYENTHIGFNNKLTEGLNTNVVLYQYFYNGAGVAIGDLNGDGLQDIYFTGNMVDNKLYLNKGKMQFEDITTQAGVAGRPGPWKTGVTMADVNGDGKLDIYICYSGKLDSAKRVNQLFINMGNNSQGIPVFKDQTAAYGLDFPSYSTQAYFFDYDRDGDLDLLLVNHNIHRLSILDEASVKEMNAQADEQAGVRLLRNDNGKFKDVSKKAGILNSTFSFGLAAGIADVNGDGWPDIYISNDYSAPDRLYINDGKGHFVDQLQKEIGHTSFYSMGNNIADINNDNLPDIYTLDMLPEDNKRQKLLFGADNYEAFNLNLKVGFYYQYMRNMLQVNNGNNTFSEIGQFSGISNTDWSWAPLFADYDNDGTKDLFITNGYTRDYTNMDFLKYMGDNLRDRSVTQEDLLKIVNKMPSSDVKNYFFKNNGDATFSNASAQWGINVPSNSNGAAYADLDNDGDLDLVVNNINQIAFVYENQSNVQSKNHFLEINLKGNQKNTYGIGTKVITYSGTKTQYLEQMPSCGFQSCVSPVLHFGLANVSIIDSLKVIWPSGKMQVLSKVKANQIITLNEDNASLNFKQTKQPKPLFNEVPAPVKTLFTGEEINDFNRQPLMVNPISFSGTMLAKGDINGDGLEDIYVGAHDGQVAKIYLQQKDKSFKPLAVPAFEATKNRTDADALIFDANGDGKPDIYVCSGGYNYYYPADALLQDRLYINDGNGKFTEQKNALPKMISSKSCVRTADINGDGYPDLFVGGRVIPGRYPEAPQSYILINNGKGVFTDETEKYNPAIKNIGMVTDAAWADMNGDKKLDLIIVGEWMPITVFINENGKLKDETTTYFDKKYVGWWNCVKVADINRDGHPDIIAGNLGANSQCKASDREPAEMYYKDFDDNGSVDPILCLYIEHKSYPCASRDQLLDQIAFLRGRFQDYKSYANATITDVFTPQEMKGAKHLRANDLLTNCFISTATGKFKRIALPEQAQYAPVYTISVFDYDKDGKEDMLLCGNTNHANLRFGKYDASFGSLLKGDGKGSFSYINQQQSGFKLVGDVRSTIDVNNMLLFSMDKGRMKAYKLN